MHRHSEIVEHAGGAPWAGVSTANLLTAEGLSETLAQPVRGGRLVTWSGWMGSSAVERDFRTWSPAAWALLDSACERIAQAAGDAEILLGPDSSHVLSDIPSCLSFFAKRPPARLGLFLDPVSMLTVDMLANAEDHLDRILSALGSHERTRAVVVSSATPSPQDEWDLGHAPLGQGRIDSAVFLRLLNQHVPAHCPLVIIGTDVEQQAAILQGL